MWTVPSNTSIAKQARRVDRRVVLPWRRFGIGIGLGLRVILASAIDRADDRAQRRDDATDRGAGPGHAVRCIGRRNGGHGASTPAELTARAMRS